MLLRFDAPPHHDLVLPEFDNPISGGQEFDLPDDRAGQVLADPTLSVVEAAQDSLAGRTRAELDQLAAGRGLDPKDFRTKQDVIDALTEPELEPEADGVGHETNPDSDKEN